ncbi:cobalt-precorrin-6A reductase [Marinomonas agarivorans]|nr:cobalt-precorrin-6A reductase [Marinomonas agarivorans]
MRILLLGGTTDARRLADALIAQGHEVIYSLAGLVRIPSMKCEVLVGGFSQFGGLTCYLQQQKQKKSAIHLLLDATHPYAQKMSNQAVLSAQETQVVCWRFCRPQWQATTSDIWHDYKDVTELLNKLSLYNVQDKTLLLTAGQFTELELTKLAELPCRKLILRTAVVPAYSLEQFTRVLWLKAIGPFTYEDEKALMEQHAVDILISKNSGGDATSAKLVVAREKGMSVFMQKRPILSTAAKEFSDTQTCLDAIAGVSNCASFIEASQ